ncbi:response regulator transcription factor [Pontibacter sp. G13]|uniref:response regulator transcription factor n=1 Tax=Pontibacter sp. G13 TaxID=3074898 RepID=UPI002889FDC9|nr:response regulator transcription factor [Pontibacter sp. G13]WNJ18098.1 response regulator transcription factor [Pontibacter sp. G13]
MIQARIFLADSAFLVREGIKAVTRDYPFEVIGEAANQRELQAKLPHYDPDIVVIDYQSPGKFTHEDVKYVREVHPEANLLVITANPEKQEVFQVLEYGVKGFLLKQCDQTEIIGAINALSRNEKFYCGKVLDIILERNETQSQRGGDACAPTRLTERETEIVALMAEGISTQSIAEKLNLSVHTIYTHRKNVMRKLGVTTAAEVILYAINSSLVTVG